MSLTLDFYCGPGIRKGNRIIPLVEHGVHFIVEDGCKVELKEEDNSLTQEQHHGVVVARNPHTRKRLLYLNTKVVEQFMLDKDGKISLHCPVCGKDYEIAQKDYNESYQKFLEGEIVGDYIE